MEYIKTSKQFQMGDVIVTKSTFKRITLNPDTLLKPDLLIGKITKIKIPSGYGITWKHGLHTTEFNFISNLIWWDDEIVLFPLSNRALMNLLKKS